MSLREWHEQLRSDDPELLGEGVGVPNLGGGASALDYEPSADEEQPELEADGNLALSDDELRALGFARGPDGAWRAPGGDGRQARRPAVEPVDLGVIVRGDTPPAAPTILRRDDEAGLLYPGQVHDLHSEPGWGKTWVAEHGCAEGLSEGGSVLVLDYESSPAVFVERLRALRVPDDVIADPARVCYVNPLAGLAAADFEELHHLAAGRALAVIDAVGPALARQGLDENSNSDVARWHEQLVRPLALAGPAVWMLDHLTKDPATRARGSRGASAKLQLVDVSYSLRQPRAFSRTKPGLLTITCAKDRNGHYSIGELVAEIDVEPQAGGLALEVRAPGERLPTVLMERVSRYLEPRTDGASKRAVEREVTGKTEGLRWALAVLEEQEYVRAGLDGYFSIRPYRDAEP